MELYVECDMGHGLEHNPDNDYFGTGISTVDGVTDYMSRRSIEFFRAYLTGLISSLGQNVFHDCENTRSGCTTDYHNDCEDNTCD